MHKIRRVEFKLHPKLLLLILHHLITFVNVTSLNNFLLDEFLTNPPDYFATLSCQYLQKIRIMIYQ